MKKLKRSLLTEEAYWVYECPNCGEYDEIYDDPKYTDEIFCQHCGERIKIIE